MKYHQELRGIGQDSVSVDLEKRLLLVMDGDIRFPWIFFGKRKYL